jgi:thymidylate kinase
MKSFLFGVGAGLALLSSVLWLLPATQQVNTSVEVKQQNTSQRRSSLPDLVMDNDSHQNGRWCLPMTLSADEYLGYPGTRSVKYIAIEGIDGAGKTTLINSLSMALRDKNFKLFVIKEPTRTEPLTASLASKNPRIRLYGQLWSREILAEQTKEQIRDSKLDFVLADRCFLSTLVYNVSDRLHDDPLNEDLDEAAYQFVKGIVPNDLVPDVIFFIDVPPKVAFVNVNARNLSIEEPLVADPKLVTEFEDLRTKYMETIHRLRNEQKMDIKIIRWGSVSFMTENILKQL